MILTLTTMFEMDGGRYSILADNYDFRCWIMERSWAFNKRNVSCIPRDEYVLERHNTTKYPNTWAFIGDGVSHYAMEGIARYACVFHIAFFPSDLQGCLSPARSIDRFGGTVGAREAWDDLAVLLDLASEPIKVLCQ